MKKTLAILLAVMMLAVMLPVTAMAATVVTDEAALKSALAAGGDVELGANITLTSNAVLNEGQSVNLDLHGYTLTGCDDGSANYYALVVKNASLYLDDSVGGGKIYAKCYGVAVSDANAYFEMNGGKIEATYNGTLSCCIVNNGGTAVINGGELISDVWAVTSEGYRAPAHVEINGGDIIVEGSSQSYASVVKVGGEYNTKGSSAEVNGGNLSGSDVISFETAANPAGSSMEASVTGGTFSEDVSEYTDGDVTVLSDASGNYYVGSDAEDALANASAGDEFAVEQGSSLSNVPEGVVINNNTSGSITVNSKPVASGGNVSALPAPRPYYAEGVSPVTYVNPAEDPNYVAPTTSEKNPATGANDMVGAAVALAVVSALGMAVISKK